MINPIIKTVIILVNQLLAQYRVITIIKPSNIEAILLANVLNPAKMRRAPQKEDPMYPEIHKDRLL